MGKVTPFNWKKKDEVTIINNFNDLLKLLNLIKQENINEEIKANINNLFDWIKKNFPEKIKFIANLDSYLKEYTPQQIREGLIRDLRNLFP